MSPLVRLRFWRRPKIFIAYRRSENVAHAGRLYADLLKSFPKKNIFFDIGTLRGGDEFPEKIEKTIQTCEALIAVIGRNWLTINKGDTRRIDDPKDFVRREIAAALNRKIVVIPVLVQDATMPTEDDLPDEIKKLAHRSALLLSDHRWDYDVGLLVDCLKGLAPLPLPVKVFPWRKLGLTAAGIVALVLGVWAAATLLPSSQPQVDPSSQPQVDNFNAGTNSNVTPPRSQTTNTAGSGQPAPNPTLGELKVYFGNLHAHTTYSDGSGTPDEAYQYAKNQGALDFLGITDHNHTRGDGMRETGPQGEQVDFVRDGLMIGTDPSLYAKTIDDATKNTKDDEFVAFYGQEFSTITSGNHLNVYSADNVILEKDVPNGRFDLLYGSWLPKHEEVSFIQFNHPFRLNDRNFDKQYGLDDYGGRYEDLRTAIARYPTLIEVIIGPALSPETSQPKLRAEDAYRLYLTRGFRLGPTASQDNHFRTWGTATDARTAVLARRLTGPDLVEALKSLRCYASTDKNLKVWFTVNRAVMGRDIEVRASEVTIEYIIDDGDEPHADYEVTVVSGSPEVPDSSIETIMESRRGKHQSSRAFTLTSPTAFIYLKIKQTSKDTTDDVVVTSPVWVKVKTS